MANLNIEEKSFVFFLQHQIVENFRNVNTVKEVYIELLVQKIYIFPQYRTVYLTNIE